MTHLRRILLGALLVGITAGFGFAGGQGEAADSVELEGRIDHEDPELAASMEDLIDSARDKLRKRSRKTLEKKSREYTRGELAFLQAVSHLEHVGDRCMRISGMIATKPGMG